MTSGAKAWSRRSDLWALCGVALGLVLVLARWWALDAEGQVFERELRRSQSEWKELEPALEEVKGLKARQEGLESLITDFVRRHKLFQLAAVVLRVPEPGVVLGGLDVRGFEVEILARADDEQALRRWVETLETDAGFEIGAEGDALEAAPEPPRFVVRGELLLSGPGDGE